MDQDSSWTSARIFARREILCILKEIMIYRKCKELFELLPVSGVTEGTGSDRKMATDKAS